MKIRNLILACLLCSSYCASAETYYVSPLGNNGTTGSLADPLFLIQEAVDNCISESDTIYLSEGTYWQHVLIAEKNGIYISSIDPLAPATFSGSGVEGLHQIEIQNSDNIQVSNLIVREHFVQDANSIYINGSGNHIYITDCEFFNIGWGSDPLADPESFSPTRQAHAILINGRTELGVQNVYIGRNQFHDIIVGNSECITLTGNTYNFLIEDNTLENITNIGIDIAGHFAWALPAEIDQSLNQARNGRIRRNIVRSCRRPTAGNEPAGIYVDGGANVIIDRNNVNNNGTGISVGCENVNKTASSITIANNIVYNNDKFGSVFGANAGNIELCTMRNNTFYNNGIFFDNSGSISIQRSTDSTIRDNIVFLTSPDYFGISAFGFIVENLTLISNQLFSPAGETPRVFAFSPAEGSTSQVFNMPFQDPLLIDPEGIEPDFQLQNNSPCIDQANPFFVPLPEELDFYGNERQIILVDVGAAEKDFVDGLKEQNVFDLSIFPNPSKGQVTIKASANIYSIRLVDIRGKTVKIVEMASGKVQQIYVEDLEAGIYVIAINTKLGMATKKLIIE